MNLIKKLSKALATASLATAMVVAPLTACNNTSTNNPSNPNNPSQPDSKYSQLLTDILKSDYYYNLLDFSVGAVSTSPIYDPHPYGFLSQHGHNITAIKNGELECETICYTKGEDKNNFYVNTRVETVDNYGDYYTCYTLKYSISDKEYEDLFEMHKYGTAQVYSAVAHL